MSHSQGDFAQLYARPVPSRRGGPLYSAFSYPTKIDPEAIALFIACHTAPNDTVLDVFAGSGTTGLAAQLCDNPTQQMKLQAVKLGLPVQWGPRSVVLYELSAIGAMLADVINNPPDPLAFQRSAARLVERVSRRIAWLYRAEDSNGNPGQIRYTVWTEVLVCPSCEAENTFWEIAVSRCPPRINPSGFCSSCAHPMRLSAAQRLLKTYRDPLLRGELVGRVRRPAYVYGRTGSRLWHRPINTADETLIETLKDSDIPACVPIRPMIKGDLYRSGYHQGIDFVHHLYTRRNLIALGTFWEEIENEPECLQEALRLLVLSYNATHSTLMTRLAAKRGMKDFAVTGAQTGVLYIGSLPLEKNIIEGIKRKTTVFVRAFYTGFNSNSSVEVVNASSTRLQLPDSSVDYVFTDPPFGGFIPYAEVNQVNEAWLGKVTDNSEEVILSRAQGKTISEYGALLSRVFSEVARVMKPDAGTTVVFHSSHPAVWGALDRAFDASTLRVVQTSLLDKEQATFKQVVAAGTTKGDAVFFLQKAGNTRQTGFLLEIDDTINLLRQQYGRDVSPQHLYTRYVAQCVGAGQPVEVNARDFYGKARRSQPLAS